MLPIDPVLSALADALDRHPAAVLAAPPGAGKTTGVPPALLGRPWLAGKRILMLEPRRLAARAAARFMAAARGEAVGETVGYRVRLDSRVSSRTRIEVVTEGVLTRMIQDDPGLDGVGLVIFDEFHERSLQADLGLALCLDAQRSLRPELRLLVMSATLDVAAVSALLGGAPVISSAGRAFPVATRYAERDPAGRTEDEVAAAVRRALAEEPGSALVFLPGESEIRRVGALLAGCLPPEVEIAPLYGNLALEAQDRAIRPAPPGRRKVVLATAIAETSLTIEGIRIVIDSGLMRVPRFDPAGGMTRLVTLRVAKASADQRRGRAGRLEPGMCYRLWSEASQRALLAYPAPEIVEADLAPLVLELALWGETDPARLSWLDPPPAAALAQAGELLTELGALDAAGRITAHGRAMAALPLHPRLAHMIVAGRALGCGGLACELAALLSERDILRLTASERDADLRRRVDHLRGRGHGGEVDRGALQRVRQAAREWQRRLRLQPHEGELGHLGSVLALAYPDRIGQRRGERSYRLRNGRGAVFTAAEPLAAEDWLAVAELDGERRDARIFLAAPLTRAEIERSCADQITIAESIRWDSRDQAVLARRQRRLGALVLEDAPLARPDPARLVAAMVEGIRELGLAALPWTRELTAWRARLAFLRRLDGEAWPDMSDEVLLATLEQWLAPHLAGITRRAHLAGIDLAGALRSRLDWRQQQTLDTLAPSHLTVPSGSRLPLDYDGGTVPVLAVRLQEMFGARETPRVADGRVPVLLHLLSPAQRPVQVTRDLAGFWAGAYLAVRKDLRGQYPKHHWPNDPLAALPTARAKPRRG